MAVNTKVLIVGGGIAGIKAALELKKNGVEFLILEAKDRLGGRLKTVQGLNSKYDLGASWFHETLNNVLFDEELSLPKDMRTNFHFDDLEYQYFDRNGEVPASSRLDPIGEELHKHMEIECQKDFSVDKSVYENAIAYLKYRRDLLTDQQIIHALAMRRYLELWHGIDIKNMSSKYCDVENEGRNALALNYDTLLKRHTDQLSHDDYMLNKPIKSIKRVEKNRRVQITTVEGEIFNSDYAIVTIPQSIIALHPEAEGGITFEPQLPKKLQDALSLIHFGALGKVILEFDHCFWDNKADRIVVLSDPPEDLFEALDGDKPLPSFPDGSSPPQSFQHPTMIMNFAVSFNKPTLLAFTQSPLTEYLESHPDKAWEYFKPMIQTISGKKDIPDPKNIITTEWTKDPYQRGSYTACIPGDDPISAVVAFEEGYGNIRFAGEHTILEGAGCVHGAWNSGKREAVYILDKINNN